MSLQSLSTPRCVPADHELLYFTSLVNSQYPLLSLMSCAACIAGESSAVGSQHTRSHVPDIVTHDTRLLVPDTFDTGSHIQNLRF